MKDSRIYFIDHDNRRLRPLESVPYADENQMQDWIAEYPDLIPGDQITPDNPRRWLLVKREMGVPDIENASGDRWSLDHLLLDQDGVPTFVEVKRAVDTRIRREVIGQMLDYAANGLAYWTVDKLRQSAAITAQARGKSLEYAVAELFDATFDDLFISIGEDSIEEYWRQVAANLANGNVRLIFAVDRAPSELRRLVEFLNGRLKGIEVLIVELKRFSGSAGDAISPVVIGASEMSRALKPASQAKSKLTRDDFLAQCPPQSRHLMTSILDMAVGLGYQIVWATASWSVRHKHKPSGDTLWFIRVWTKNWDMNLFTYPYSKFDSELGRSFRSRVEACGLFPFKKGTEYISIPHLSDEVAGTLLPLLRDHLETGKRLASTPYIEGVRNNEGIALDED